MIFEFPALFSPVPGPIKLIPEINVSGVGPVLPWKFQPDRSTGLGLVRIVTDRQQTDRQTDGAPPLYAWPTPFFATSTPLASLGGWITQKVSGNPEKISINSKSVKSWQKPYLIVEMYLEGNWITLNAHFLYFPEYTKIGDFGSKLRLLNGFFGPWNAYHCS